MTHRKSRKGPTVPSPLSLSPDAQDVNRPDKSPGLLSAPTVDSPFQKIVVVNQPTTPHTLPSEAGGVAYAGLKTTLEALRGPAAIFPPLKTAVEGIISILTIVDVRSRLSHTNLLEYSYMMTKQKYIQNKQDFQDLKQNIEALRSIVEVYGSHDALKPRISSLSKYANLFTQEMS